MPIKSQLNSTASKSLIDDITVLLHHCGKTSFSTVLMGFLAKSMRADHLSIFLFDKHFVPHLVVCESAGNRKLAKKAGEIYQNSHFYRYDPNAKQIKLSHNNAGAMLVRLRAEEISDDDYRRDIYERFGLLDRVSLIDYYHDRWVVTNLYREKTSGEFEPKTLKFIEELANLLSGLLEKHFLLLPPTAWQSITRPSKKMLEKIVMGLNTSLSQREIEVCARAVLGMTSNGIGLELGIQTATVNTLKKRAYAKLNISGLNELFALCLSKAVGLSTNKNR